MSKVESSSPRTSITVHDSLDSQDIQVLKRFKDRQQRPPQVIQSPRPNLDNPRQQPAQEVDNVANMPRPVPMGGDPRRSSPQSFTGAPQQSSSGVDIRFGIELEFATGMDHIRTYSCDGDDVLSYPFIRETRGRDSAYYALALNIARLGYPAACYFETDSAKIAPFLTEMTPAGTPPGKMIRGMYYLNPDKFAGKSGDKEEARCWVLKNEADATSPYSGFTNWVATELTSPVFDIGEAYTGYKSIKKVLKSIHEAASKQVHTFHRTGLHVHVSMGTSPPLRALKRIVTLLLLFDDKLVYSLFDTVRKDTCSSMRRAATEGIDRSARRAGDFSGWQNLPESKEFLSSDGHDDLPKEVLLAAPPELKFIWNAKAESDLQWLRKFGLGAWVRCPIQLVHHYTGPGTEPYVTTLEFRQAPASFSHAMISRWLDIVLSICKLSTLSSSRYKAAIKAMWDETKIAPTGQTGSLSANLIDNLGHLLEQEWPIRLDGRDWEERIRRTAANQDLDTHGRLALLD